MFKKGECNLMLTGNLDLQVGKGWVGQCCKGE